MSVAHVKSPMLTWITTLIGIAALLVFPMFAEVWLSPFAALLAFAAFCLALLHSREPQVFAGLLLACFMLLFWRFSGKLFFWPMHLLLPLAGAVVLVGVLTSQQKGILRRVGALFPLGALNKDNTLFAVSICACSIIGLYFWQLLANANLSAYKAMIPDGALLPVLMAGLGFSLINASLEEAIWRGVFLDCLMRLSNFPTAALVSSFSFGLAHANGVPSGNLGIVLSFIFGLLLCELKRRSQGLLLPVCAHILTNVFIFWIIYRYNPIDIPISSQLTLGL